MIARSASEIFKRMLAYTLARTRLSDIRETDPMVHILMSVANEIAKSDQNAVIRDNESTLDGAENEILDDVLEAILPDGQERSQGYFATGGLVVFYRPSGSSGDLIVATGTIVRRARDGMLYRTLADATFTGVNTTSSAVAVVCVTKGASGNCNSIGEITQLGQAIAGVSSCSNTAIITNGADYENDQAARDRARRHIRGISPCTHNGILARVLNYESSDYGQALFATFGEYDPTKPGFATLYVDDGNGTSGPVVNRVAEIASSTLLNGNYILWTRYPAIETLPAVSWGGGGSIPAWQYTIESTGQILVRASSLMPAPADGMFDIGAYTTYGGLVGELQALINGRLPDVSEQGYAGAGDIITVKPARFTGYATITANITYAPNVNITTLNTTLKTALTTYVNSNIGIGQSLLLADIIAVLKSNASVLNVDNVTINGSASDEVADADEVIRIQPTTISFT